MTSIDSRPSNDKLMQEAHDTCQFSGLPGHDKAVLIGDNPGGCVNGDMHEKVNALGDALKEAQQPPSTKACLITDELVEELKRENADLKRRLEGAHIYDCSCPQPDSMRSYIDPRCLALREGK